MSQSTEKSLGQVMYEARQEAFAIESRYPWDALAASVQEAFDAQAQAVAAVVRAQQAQEIEALRAQVQQQALDLITARSEAEEAHTDAQRYRRLCGRRDGDEGKP